MSTREKKNGIVPITRNDLFYLLGEAQLSA